MPLASSLAVSSSLPGGRQIAVVALALATAISVRSVLRSLRDRSRERRSKDPETTTMEDFVDP